MMNSKASDCKASLDCNLSNGTCRQAPACILRVHLQGSNLSSTQHSGVPGEGSSSLCIKFNPGWHQLAPAACLPGNLPSAADDDSSDSQSSCTRPDNQRTAGSRPSRRAPLRAAHIAYQREFRTTHLMAGAVSIQRRATIPLIGRRSSRGCCIAHPQGMVWGSLQRQKQAQRACTPLQAQAVRGQAQVQRPQP